MIGSRRLAGVYLAAIVTCLAGSACSGDPQAAAARRVESGDRFAKEGKTREAILEYRAAVQADPLHSTAHARLAEAYANSGDSRNAAQEYVKAADLAPNDNTLQFKAGYYLQVTGQHEDAKSRADRILKTDPRNMDAQILLGNALARVRDLSSGIELLESAIQGDPTSTAAYYNLGVMQFAAGDLKRAEQAFKNAVASAPNAVAPRLALANFYWSGGLVKEAEAEFRETLKLEPGNQLANRAMALFLVSSNRVAEAEAYFKAVAAASADDPAPQIVLADYYQVTGRSQQAEEILYKLINDPVAGPRARVRMAALNYAARPPVAHQMVDEVLAKDADSPIALLVKGRFLAIEHKYDEAAGLVRRAVQADPRLTAAWGTLGDIQTARREWDEAIAAYNEVLKLQPRSTEAQLKLAEVQLAKGVPAAAETFAMQAVSANPENTSARLALARVFMAKGDYARAEQELNRVVTGKTVPVAAQLQLGQLRLAQKNYAAAGRAFDAVLKANPSSIDALDGRIAVALGEKRLQDARQMVEAAVAKRPGDSRIQLLAARTYEALGETDNAEKAARAALQANAAEYDAYFLLARNFVRTKRLEAAKQEFEQLIARQPKSVAAQTMLGMVLQIQGRTNDAQVQYEKALQIDPQAGVAANNLAWILAESGASLDLAMQHAQLAKSKLPGRAEIVDTLGWVYYKKGLSALAVAEFKEAAALDPKTPVYWYHLGLAHAQGNQKPEARTALEKALSLSPTFSEADQARKILGTLGSAK